MASDSNKNSQPDQKASPEFRPLATELESWLASERKSALVGEISFLVTSLLFLAWMTVQYALDNNRAANAKPVTNVERSFSIKGSPVEVDKAPMSSRQNHSNGGALSPQ